MRDPSGTLMPSRTGGENHFYLFHADGASMTGLHLMIAVEPLPSMAAAVYRSPTVLSCLCQCPTLSVRQKRHRAVQIPWTSPQSVRMFKFCTACNFYLKFYVNFGLVQVRAFWELNANIQNHSSGSSTISLNRIMATLPRIGIGRLNCFMCAD